MAPRSGYYEVATCWGVALKDACCFDKWIRGGRPARVPLLHFREPGDPCLAGRSAIARPTTRARGSGGRPAPAPTSAATPYTLDLSRTVGNKCKTIADCAKDGSSSYLRGACTAAGTCVSIDGKGAVAKDDACDSDSDCASGLCAVRPFTDNVDKRAFCSVACTTDAECGENRVCTTGFDPTICTAKCTKDSECPVNAGNVPASGPWSYQICDVATGKCSPCA